MPSTNLAVTRVAQSATSVPLAGDNDRIGIFIHNDSTSELRVAYGATASATVYSVAIPAGALWESPFGINSGDGRIAGIWAGAGAGAAQVTEVYT